MAQSHTSAASALVVGAGGGIGAALLRRLLDREDLARVYAVSRRPAPRDAGFPDGADLSGRLCWLSCDHSDEAIAAVAERLARDEAPLARIALCMGLLHRDALQPEKTLQRLQRVHMEEVLRVNTVLPALWLSALMPLLRGSQPTVVAAISARVGSIGDNRLGGWYSYRASKAALNMICRSAAIEFARRAPRAKLIAFHPGTTDTALSRPFQSRVPAEKLFSPDFVAGQLLALMDRAEPDGELDYVDWAGESIPW